MSSPRTQPDGRAPPAGGDPRASQPPRRGQLWIPDGAARGAPSRGAADPRLPSFGSHRDPFAAAATPYPAQGSDEDWSPAAEQRLSDPQAAVAASPGQVAVRASRGRGIDIHELLKREAFGAPGGACDSHFEKNRPCPDAPLGSSNQYVVLDSWVKDLGRSAPAQGLLSWNFMVQGVSGDQVVGVADKVDTVVEMQIGSFTIPVLYPGAQTTNDPASPGVSGLLPGLPVLVAGYEVFAPPDPSAVIAYTFSQFPFVGRISIGVAEIGNQSISQLGGVRYHFEADVVPIFPAQGTLSTALGTPIANASNPYPVALRVVPVPGFDTYVFTDPIKDILGVSLSLRSIDRPLALPPDVILGAQLYTSASVWPYLGLLLPSPSQAEANALRAFLVYSVGLTQVSISGASTGNAPIDNWLNQSPSVVASLPFGYAAGIGINAIDFAVSTETQVGMTLAPQVGVSVLVPAAPAAVQFIPTTLPVTVRFTTARVRIPMRFKRMVQRLTNYQ